MILRLILPKKHKAQIGFVKLSILRYMEDSVFRIIILPLSSNHQWFAFGYHN